MWSLSEAWKEFPVIWSLLVYLEFAEACGDGVGGLGVGRMQLHSLSLLAS